MQAAIASTRVLAPSLLLFAGVLPKPGLGAEVMAAEWVLADNEKSPFFHSPAFNNHQAGEKPRLLLC